MGQKTPSIQSKYTQPRKKKILTYLREGRHITHAAILSGITASTLYNWMKWADEGNTAFDNFGDLVRKAKAIGEVALEKRVMELCHMGKNPDARTMMTMLMTKNRDVYANLEKVEISGKVVIGIPDIIAAIDADEKENEDDDGD